MLRKPVKSKVFARSILASLFLLALLLGDAAKADSNHNPNSGTSQLSTSMPGTQIDPSTGAVTASLPIDVLPGRGGIAPELSLQYSSLPCRGFSDAGRPRNYCGAKAA